MGFAKAQPILRAGNNTLSDLCHARPTKTKTIIRRHRRTGSFSISTVSYTHLDVYKRQEFTKVAEAFGAYVEKVSDPADVPAAIARCAKEVRGGRTALLHACVTRL